MTESIDTSSCPRDEIAAYLDGELSSTLADEFEGHVRDCETCSRALREQRQFLASLSASLGEDPGVRLPSNFAKRVIAAAESRVSGLRSPHEQFTAIFISAALLFFSMFALGSGFGDAVLWVAALSEKLAAFALFSGRAAANVLAAASVVVRSLFAASSGWLYLAAFVVVTIAAGALARQISRAVHLSAKN